MTTLLQTRNLSKNFGGLAAVQSVDFDLQQGEIRAIIGPNGAGKSTLVGLISGRIAPSAGTIAFQGQFITKLPAHARVARGIAYTFQITSIFANLTCRENILLPAQRAAVAASGVFGRVDEAALITRVDEILARVGLRDQADTKAKEMAYGHQRLLEVGMGLALDAKLLILDEPTQGLADSEIANFIDLIRTVSRDTTILLIEHNMTVVMDLAQRITVMNFGEVLAEGTPEEIRANHDVQTAYLGG
jgi:branched-chain amino acid transport system ATP-binding protein